MAERDYEGWRDFWNDALRMHPGLPGPAGTDCSNCGWPHFGPPGEICDQVVEEKGDSHIGLSFGYPYYRKRHEQETARAT